MRSQPVAVLVQVRQREGRAQPLVIFPDGAIAHLCKSEDTFENAERPLRLRSHVGLGGVLVFGFFIHSGSRLPLEFLVDEGA